MKENTNNQRITIRTKLQASIPIAAQFGQIYPIYDGNDEWFWKQGENTALEAERIYYIKEILQRKSKNGEPIYYGIVKNKDGKIEVTTVYARRHATLEKNRNVVFLCSKTILGNIKT
jgi:hypothetical protein